MGSEFLAVGGEDAARRAWQLQQKIRQYQESFSVLEKVGAPPGPPPAPNTPPNPLSPPVTSATAPRTPGSR
ncbi:Delta(3,5)-Delta(2,4)-dienoyl-CoA isomerase, mitochondrial [Aix galericulata]|nr:Delta(3,5)-Delta(2,4)-dienoyl-CoA isomerase, mitochondrial [Aix galericulata]